MTPQQHARTTTITTPNGPFSVIFTSASSVLAAGWCEEPQMLLPLIHARIRPPRIEPVPASSAGPVTDAVVAYYDGDPAPAGTVAVEQQSGDFIMNAWKVLRDVAPGAPVTYQTLAERAGNPAAFRAAAAACARNAAALFVPCHRVVRTGGALGGFRWSLGTKQWLLHHEATMFRGSR